ncbi:hypothetical protein APHAL10511_000510 [Amanita phalloides]|nr:hypothetical protein APHAL10511_000510 [Amanita phalloides]
MTRVKIAIVGAGIGGLMLASCIAQMDQQKRIELDIYESTVELAVIGAGINLWPRAFEMLVSIGLKDEVLQLCEQADDDSSLAFEFRKSDQKKGHPIFNLYIPGGIVRIHRADLQKVLLKCALRRARLHLSSKLVSYTEHQDSVHLVFENGSRGTCDLLVGADGIKSTVRRLFLMSRPGSGYQDSIDPIWTGTYAYRGIIPRDELEQRMSGHRAAKVPVMYIGKSKHIVAYPMSHGRLINVLGLVHHESREETDHEGPLVQNVPQEEIKSVFQGWEPEVQALVQCISNPTKWAVHHLRPLKRYGERRVLLLGDAAHAMGPHQGTGAGQAMEDAYLLTCVLTHPDVAHELKSQMPMITGIYDTVRRPVGNASLMLTKTCGKLTGLTDDDIELPRVKEGDDKVPHDVLVKYIKKLEHKWQWLWDGSTRVEDQCQEASSLLRGLRRREAKL